MTGHQPGQKTETMRITLAMASLAASARAASDAMRTLAAASRASDRRIAETRHTRQWLDAYRDAIKEREGTERLRHRRYSSSWIPSTEDRAAARKHADRVSAAAEEATR
jgi:hypothetical protein